MRPPVRPSVRGKTDVAAIKRDVRRLLNSDPDSAKRIAPGIVYRAPNSDSILELQNSSRVRRVQIQRSVTDLRCTCTRRRRLLAPRAVLLRRTTLSVFVSPSDESSTTVVRFGREQIDRTHKIVTGSRTVAPTCAGIESDGRFWFDLFILRPCRHDDDYVDGRSQIRVHTEERSQVYSATCSLVVTHPSNQSDCNYPHRIAVSIMILLL